MPSSGDTPDDAIAYDPHLRHAVTDSTRRPNIEYSIRTNVFGGSGSPTDVGSADARSSVLARALGGSPCASWPAAPLENLITSMDVFNLADLWEAVADRVPDRVALRCGEQRRTYAQLEEQSNRLAHWYLEQGVQTGDHIGLYVENCVEYVEATLAAYKVRAVPVNINYRYTAGELQHLFNDADLVGVVHQWGFTEPCDGGGTPGPDAAVETGHRFDVRRRPGLVVAGRGTLPLGRGTITTSCTPAAPRVCPRAWCGDRKTPSSPVWGVAIPPFPRSRRSRSCSSASLPIRAPFCSSLR